VGLCDGARRPIGRCLRPQAAPEARQASPQYSYIHTHFGVGYRFAPEQDGGELEQLAHSPAAADPDVAEATESANAEPALAG